MLANAGMPNVGPGAVLYPTDGGCGGIDDQHIRNGLLMGVFLFATTEPQLNFGPEAQESKAGIVPLYRNV